MRLKVLGSSSSGNCYILETDTEVLVIECGVKFSEVKKAIDFNINKVAGCLITHEHGDHSKYVNDVLNSCIDVWLSEGTMHNLKLKSSRLPLFVIAKTRSDSCSISMIVRFPFYGSSQKYLDFQK